YGELKPLAYESDLAFTPCLINFTQKYFHSERALRGSLVIINFGKHPEGFFLLKILEALNEDKNHTFGLMPKDGRWHDDPAKVIDKAQNYMLIMLDMDDLRLNVDQWKSLPTWNPLAQTIIVLLKTFDTIKEKDEFVRRVFEELLADGILFVNILFRMTSTLNKMAVETWFPYYDKGCARFVDNIYKIGECIVSEKMNRLTGISEKTWKIYEFNEEKYPKIPKIFNNCPLIISTFVWEPFVVGNEKIETGLEILMIKTIAQQMDIKLQFNIINDDLVTAKISGDNQTGIYSDVLQKKADLMLGGLYENPISRKLVSPSIPYYQDDITWCVAKAKFAQTWLNVFIIFNLTTWFIIIFTLVASSVFLYAIAYFTKQTKENFTWVFLITVTLSTGQYGHYWPNRSSIRFFLIILYFYGLHINTAYHSSLINVLTNPRYEDQIKTMEMAIEAGLTFEVNVNTMEFFNSKGDWISKYLLSNHKLCRNIDKCFKKIKKDRKVAVALSRAHALNNPFRFIEDEDFFCFPVSDDVVIYSVVMMFRRFHHLLADINKKIRTISESGLLTKWQKDSQSEGDNEVEDSSDAVGHGSVKMVLRVEHVEGAFLLVLLGLATGFLVFLVELSIFYIRKKYKIIMKRRNEKKNIRK
ncbi:CLUMA_CG001153, isoform A, partial [Clunio marinus]